MMIFALVHERRIMNNIFEEELRDWKEESSLSALMYSISWNRGIIYIYTTNPGSLVGLKGCRVEKYRNIIKEIWPQFIDFNFIETWGIV